MFVVGIVLTVDVGRLNLLCVGVPFHRLGPELFKSEKIYKHPSSKDAFILFVLDWGCDMTSCLDFLRMKDYILVNK